MKLSKKLALFFISAAVSATASATVTPTEAAKLGTELTPTGAERAANADGSIPAWNPDGWPIPAGFEPGSDFYIDPYAGEKPLYTIDAGNWHQYEAVLTEGSRAMFEKLGPKGFRMEVYPSKRDFITHQWFYDNTARNATGATLVADGQKIEGNLPGVPFPIPQSGLEALWNHMVRLSSDHTLTVDTYYVSADGKPILSTQGLLTDVFPMFKQPDQEVGDTPWMKLRVNYTAPARRAGEILLVHEPGADYTEGKGRKAWQYLTGQRRVRLAPAVSFDTPSPAVAGTSTYDDSFIFNGSPERYDWKLIGKKEMIVPYSNNRLTFETKVQDALLEHFINPELVRWEKHRVWVVEGDLKPGMRHLYSKRRYYLDEDTWAALAGETYDGRGNLWRVQYAYIGFLYDDMKSMYTEAYGGYDLVQGIYNINGKPIPGTFSNGVTESEKYFTAKGMARSGVR